MRQRLRDIRNWERRQYVPLPARAALHPHLMIDAPMDDERDLRDDGQDMKTRSTLINRLCGGWLPPAVRRTAVPGGWLPSHAAAMKEAGRIQSGNKEGIIDMYNNERNGNNNRGGAWHYRKNLFTFAQEVRCVWAVRSKNMDAAYGGTRAGYPSNQLLHAYPAAQKLFTNKPFNRLYNQKEQ